MTQPPNRPWLRSFGFVPRSFDDPRLTLHEAAARTAHRAPDAHARHFFGTTWTHRALVQASEAGGRRTLPKSGVGKVDFKAPTVQRAESTTGAAQ